MKAETLAEKVRKATPEEQRLIAQILKAPKPLKNSMSEALSETEKNKAFGGLFQSVIDTTVRAGKVVKITPKSSLPRGSLETMVKFFTQPEVLKVLAPEDPLAAARLKGLQVKNDLLYDDDTPLTSQQVADLLDIRRQAVDKRRLNSQLLAVSIGKRGYFYPSWQFHEGKVLPGIDKVLDALKDSDGWTQLMFFRTGDVRLNGATPLEQLRSGNIDAVVWAAECYGKHGAA